MMCLVSGQGTACPETGLCSEHDTAANREKVEQQTKQDKAVWGEDNAIPGTWTDCTENDLVSCAVCGYPEGEVPGFDSA